ncbi:MAG: DNA primase [Rhodothermales bacterium]
MRCNRAADLRLPDLRLETVLMIIPDDKVEEVRSASDIVGVVGDYVRLKRRGSNFIGLCPFHNEKTPSFNVNPSLGIFKCFGCGAGGDVFSFIQRTESLGFVETVRLLAERAGIELPDEDNQDREAYNETESIYHALRLAARFFYTNLTQHEAGAEALAYVKGRGITPESVKGFGMGYALNGWDGLLKHAETKQVSPEVLGQAGLVIKRNDGSGYYDRYRGRVIFPIFSHVGKVLGFGGRIMQSDPKQPKYINSPETKVYHKSRVLYGLYQGKQAIRRDEEVILVEGYTDVIALHQAGVQNVVASSGTALTPEQVKMVGRYAKKIVMLYDADAAGAKAALRGIDIVLEQGLTAYAVSLPGGEDPDSYVQAHGGEAFREYVKTQRLDFVRFKHELAQRAGAFDTPEGTAEAQRGVIETIARIPDPLMRETYMRTASDVLRVPDSYLYPVLERAVLDHSRQRSRTSRRQEEPRRYDEPPSTVAPPRPFAPIPDEIPHDVDLVEAPVHAEPKPEEKALLRMMLEHGMEMIEFVLSYMGVDEFTRGPSRTMVEQFIGMYEDEVVDTTSLYDGTHGRAVQQLASEVSMTRYEPSKGWQEKINVTVPRLDENSREAATSAMTLLKLDRVDEAIEALKRKQYNERPEGEALHDTLTGIMDLQKLRDQIKQRAFLEWYGDE